MAHYRFLFNKTHQHYLSIVLETPHDGSNEVKFILPAWRPGRYEMGNFAKNIRDFFPTDQNGQALKFRKADAQTWIVNAPGATKISLSYSYYANIVDAGNSYIGSDILYANPVNCCFYKEGTLAEPCSLHLDVPEHFKIAVALPAGKGRGVYEAKDFHQLADSPFICSPTLLHEELKYGDASIHFWFQGMDKIEWKQLSADVKKFTKAQVDAFGELPSKDYHYLCIISPGNAHHGVEHTDSTVLYFGPAAHLWDKEKYEEFLGLCSHEFYHLWNVKRIRPVEMMPYNYQQPNYSSQGYIYEGVTTYYGDLMLLRGEVIGFSEYAHSLSNDLQRHFDNPGRFHYSVAESSFDTWLDGYVPGAPGRKVNIYVEGSMAAMILDIQLLKHSNGKQGLDEVMRHLYRDFALKGKGYSYEDYKQIVTALWTEDQAKKYFERAIEGRGFLEADLPAALHEIGLEMAAEPAKHTWMDVFGFKMGKSTNGHGIIQAVFPGSPADEAGLDYNYEVVKVNGRLLAEAEDWDLLFRDEVIGTLSLDLEKQGTAQHIMLEPARKGMIPPAGSHLINGGIHFYPKINVKKQETTTDSQRALFKAWSGQKF